MPRFTVPFEPATMHVCLLNVTIEPCMMQQLLDQSPPTLCHILPT